jgi:hypothetical protein
MVGIMLSGSQQKEHVLNRLGYGQSVCGIAIATTPLGAPRM